MANVIRDPREHPDAILADFSTPNPLVTFTKEDVAFTYGTKWKQRYFTKIGDDFFVFPPEDHWLHDVEIEGSLDYVATGLPEGAPRWSFSLVFVVPVVRGR